MIVNKNEIENMIEETTTKNSDKNFKYWLGKDDFPGLEDLFKDATISELKVIINSNLEKSAKTLNFPWIEFILPYYISETILSKVCKEYIEEGSWESVRICRMSYLKEEYHLGEEHYFSLPVTKFVFTSSKEIDKQVRAFYGEDLKNGKWQTIA